MTIRKRVIALLYVWALYVSLFVGLAELSADGPLVIAHRGASGYVPEHTLEAKAMAHAMGADFIEQDVVLSKDDVPVVLHDIHLDTVTNVAEVFPERARDDGRYYAIDFTLAEIKELNATERINLKTGKAYYPKRFPARQSNFSVPTLAEEIELIQGLNISTGREAGIYPEIKNPAFHRKEGKDISKIVIDTIGRYGYKTKQDKCFVQCFDIKETKRIRNELRCQTRIVQLTGGVGYKKILSREGLKELAKYADGIGPSLSSVLALVDGKMNVKPLVADAHAAGLVVHPYTLRADEVPSGFESYRQMVQVVFGDAQVDGAFTDFPDKTIAAIETLSGSRD